MSERCHEIIAEGRRVHELRHNGKFARFSCSWRASGPHDEIWCVFDVDAHPKLAEAIELAGRHGIEVAVSSPCFELWFILHYEDQTAHIERHPAQARAKGLLGCGKVLSPDALNALADRHDDAVKRAKALDKKHKGDGSPPRSNPSSEAWKLVDRIRYPDT